MSNISPPASKPPAFKAASKGDGGGNGGGGMYFGQGHQQEDDEYWFSGSRRYYPEADTNDIPFFTPIFNFVSSALGLWKTVLATHLYSRSEDRH